MGNMYSITTIKLLYVQTLGSAKALSLNYWHKAENQHKWHPTIRIQMYSILKKKPNQKPLDLENLSETFYILTAKSDWH